tara:strand:- start:1079 stop:1198 length:120 start_codon:yes stop_codon:yes gene_type:complete
MIDRLIGKPDPAPLPRAEVVQVRKFIESCGTDPKSDYPL